MRIAFLSPPAQGHLNPMTTLPRELQSRDHDEVFISLLDGEPLVRVAGLAFIPCCEKEFPAGSANERYRQIGKLQGEEAMRAVVKGIAARTQAMLKSLPSTFGAGVAARIAAKKFGMVLPLKELSPARLSTLIGEVLKNPIYRENVRYLQKIIAERNGLAMAADILERAFGLTKKTGASSDKK